MPAGDALAVHLDRVRSDELAEALEDRDLARLDQALQALVEPTDHRGLVLVHAVHVDVVESRVHAEVRALTGVVGELGGVQERLGRDAPVVQAGAADLVGLDEATVLPSCAARSAAA